MTATFNNTLLSYLSRICGYSIKSQHTFWADKKSFRKRYIDISVVFTPQKRKVIKESILETCANNLQNKLIVYSNVSSRLEEIQHDVDDWMDENEKLVGDTILINGELESEWKFISVQKFTNTTTELNKVVGDNQFYPRILFATASCIGAGLDSKDVRKVIREGFPPSILDFIQEMGRCGRNVNDMSDNHMGSKDEYKLILSLNEFIYMYERIYLHSSLTKEEEDRIGKIVSTDKLKNEQRELLLSLLSMIVLDKGCWHIQLERTLAQDETVSIAQQSRDEPCFNKCPNCNTNRNKKLGYVVPIKKRGMKKFLSRTFVQGEATMTTAELMKELKEYPNVGRLIYGRRVDGAPKPKVLEITILQLIASDILELSIEKRGEKDTVCVGIKAIKTDNEDDDDIICFMQDESWKYFYLKVDDQTAIL